jgi:NAD(P)-dependent dehydrogenase (short-subunit alcohol dehydrogenase family)
MAVEFARAGFDVLLTYHQDAAGAAAAAAAVESHGRSGVVHQGDVECWGDVVRATNAVIELWGRLDCLVNNAGGAYRWAGPTGTAVVDLDEEAWDATIGLNLKGPFLGIKAAAPHMIARGKGHIINIGSGAGLVGTAGRSAYSAAKAGLIGLTKAAARELGPAGVQVNTICPGLVLHQSLVDNEALTDDEVAKAVAGKVLGRAGDAEEFARFVVMVAQMKNISGQILNTDSRIT